MPQRVGPGERVFAGTINLGAPLRIRVRAVGEGTLLAEIVRLMELAEQRRSRFVAIADRVARAYAPVVHSLALLTFLGWTLSGAAPWQTALLYAIAVLIITCPCALGLAVPAVQVLASSRLMRRGTLLKSATALERFAQADMVVFDKTGTLTEGRLALLPGAVRRGRSGGRGRHGPRLAPSAGPGPGGGGTAGAERRAGVEEVPGCGLRLRDARAASGASAAATGRPAWRRTRRWAPSCGWPGRARRRSGSPSPTALRADAAAVVAELQRRGYAVALLSGDRPQTARCGMWRPSSASPTGRAAAARPTRRPGSRPGPRRGARC